MPSFPLAQVTTLGLGGPAEELVEAGDPALLAQWITAADQASRRLLVLGGGSNIVVPDQGFPGLVVRVALAGATFVPASGGAVGLTAGAGEDWSSLVARCVAEGLAGLECLSGIPGSVGATPVQNVGAYGQEVADVIDSVHAWDRQARTHMVFRPEECAFSYRDSIFKRTGRFVVTAVTFRLERATQSQPLRYRELAARLGTEVGRRAPLAETTQAVLDLRRAKGMVLDPSDPDTRSAGSFFMNPILTASEFSDLQQSAPNIPSWPADAGTKVSAAWLVEKAGFSKGHRHGTAAISSKHALALTALPGGSSHDLLSLARDIRRAVQENFGVLLEPEPLLIDMYL